MMMNVKKIVATLIAGTGAWTMAVSSQTTNPVGFAIMGFALMLLGAWTWRVEE